MMRLLKIYKGMFQYINKKRIYETAKTAVLFAFAIGLYLIGYITLKTNKSFWSIFAVLSVLPAAKSAVNMIMFYKFRSTPLEDYTKIEGVRGKIPVVYDLIFTTAETSYLVKSAACYDSTVIMLMEPKAKKKQESMNDLKNHIAAAFERDNIKDFSIKIYSDLGDYCTRLKEMDSKLVKENDRSSDIAFALFNAITL